MSMETTKKPCRAEDGLVTVPKKRIGLLRNGVSRAPWKQQGQQDSGKLQLGGRGRLEVVSC